MSEQHDDHGPDFSDVEAELGLGLPPLPPPPALKARVLAAIADLPQQAPARAEAPTEPQRVTPLPVTRPHETVPGPAGRAPGDGAGADTAADRPEPVHDGRDADVVQLRRWRRTAAWLGAAAAVLLVAGVALGGWASSLNQQRVDAEQRLSDQAARQNAALEVFTAPDAVIRAAQAGTGGSVSIASSKSLNRSAVISRDLPALSANQTYELWYLTGQQARAAGTFSASGGVAYTSLEGRLDGATHIGMTVEPAGGSPAPTTTPIVVQPTA
ncbi:hypothetical protein GCM10011512_03450 [Tersicoccus solisilvae]|uniref:Anti-sigma K factor RskA C-terminal domain-containing protein n=1 Tax=Tersicoccus solisilvae TaxID=1882339 RepID=A0ABQ1NNX1_9MICC|nr:anti-sigma factor [Tersicoccus solisilvae]GGC80080.1 hypothetical protein GCM10011512_03450 [Tersicoccus solisilvae]